MTIAPGGGGGITASGTDTLTNKTIDGDDNTLKDVGFTQLKCTVDEDTMSSDSAVLLPSQQSVKAYVDATSTPVLISTQTASASAALTVSSIPQTYKRLLIVFRDIISSQAQTGARLYVGHTTTETSGTMFQSGALTVNSITVTGAAIAGYYIRMMSESASTNTLGTTNPFNGWLTIDFYNDAVTDKLFTGAGNYLSYSGSNQCTTQCNGVYRAANVIDIVTFKLGSSSSTYNITSGTMSVYGIK